MKNINMVVMLLVTILFVGCGSKTHEETMLDIYENKGYDKAMEYVDNIEDPVAKLELTLELKASSLGMTVEEYEKMLSDYDNSKNAYKKVDIIDKEITDNKLKVTLQNNTGKTLRYVKIDIFHYDKDGNVKDTEWANKSGTFEDKGEFIIETYVDIPKDAVKYKVQVSEANIK